jgi:hypothetical protein
MQSSNRLNQNLHTPFEIKHKSTESKILHRNLLRTLQHQTRNLIHIGAPVSEIKREQGQTDRHVD